MEAAQQQKRDYDTGGVMSFDEIGERLGMTGGGAWMLYRSAMRKLRKKCNERALREFEALVQMRTRREF